MRIAVVGGLARKDENFIFSILEGIVRKGDTIVSGGAIGVDAMAAKYAKKNGIELKEYLPEAEDWAHYKKRNELIAADCELLLAFPSKFSSGTYFTATKAREFSARVIVFPPA